MTHGLAVLGILFLAATVVAAFTDTTETTEAAEDEAWDDLLLAVAVLEEGTREEKLAIFSPQDPGGGTPFAALHAPPDGDTAATEEIVERIRDYFFAETDIWVLDRVAKSLASTQVSAATPIFAELSRHKAPSLRYRAIEHLMINSARESKTLLEAMWRESHPAWVRAQLINALALFKRSGVAVEDCKELLTSPDDEVASAAVRCIGIAGSSEASSLLLRRAVAGDSHSVEAIEALSLLVPRMSSELRSETRFVLEAMWRDGAEPWLAPALLRLLHQLHSPLARRIAAERVADDDHPELALQAIGVLGESTDRAAFLLLVERAATGAPALRRAALLGLSGRSAEPAVERVLLAATDPIESEEVRLAAIASMEHVALSNRQDVSERYRRWLDALAVSEEESLVRQAAERAAQNLRSGAVTVTISCGGTGWFGPDRRTLESFDGGTSLRCHDEPGVESDPVRAIRIETGKVVLLTDRFDDGRKAWGKVALGQRACWVPLDRFRSVAPWEEIEDQARESLDEFDLPLSELRREAFRSLEEAGLVSAFDYGATLAAVRLTHDPELPAEVERLREASTENDEPLARGIRRALAASGVPDAR